MQCKGGLGGGDKSNLAFRFVPVADIEKAFAIADYPKQELEKRLAVCRAASPWRRYCHGQRVGAKGDA